MIRLFIWAVSQLSFHSNTWPMLRKFFEPSNRRDCQVIHSFPCLPSNLSQKNHLAIQSPAFGQVSTKPYILTGCVETATHAPGVGYKYSSSYANLA
ncbi:hypothetical protein K443DRAFT_294199 [Laccaria amethystina LaAM-08-1]|uniref:Uncharacterized protein n=1 Tax=Laccaria amethystina LaAM-08-1 TaxID=1095629 RepID=A0A0C9WUZ5_9AGAR|nr:hypothetical protein K443DRAFT_294199 [Laccaria amethystina LaAM-08-1]